MPFVKEELYLLDQDPTYLTRVMLTRVDSLAIQTRVLDHTEVVEEQVGLEGGQRLELDLANLTFIDTAQTPGGSTLLGKNI